MDAGHSADTSLFAARGGRLLTWTVTALVMNPLAVPLSSTFNLCVACTHATLRSGVEELVACRLASPAETSTFSQEVLDASNACSR